MDLLDFIDVCCNISLFVSDLIILGFNLLFFWLIWVKVWPFLNLFKNQLYISLVLGKFVHFHFLSSFSLPLVAEAGVRVCGGQPSLSKAITAMDSALMPEIIFNCSLICG